MSFDDYFVIIKNKLKQLCDIDIKAEDYDGMIVKKLAQSNTIHKDISSKQTHIAITGDQMSLFPFINPMRQLSANDFFLKNFFILKAPVNIYKRNCDYLEAGHIDFHGNEILKEEFCIYPREDGTQVQLSMLRKDSENFIRFREIIQPNSYLIMLKRMNQVAYDAFALKETDLDDQKGFITIKKVSDYGSFVTSRNFVESPTENYIIENETSGENEKGKNILFYGVAGVGKSYNINKITGGNESNIERIVFHPDYLNTDFVGQILPTVKDNGNIDYQFKAGSFTKILKKAILDPSNHYYLVIEEINRGNAPAIFGEVFQLLDRNTDGKSTYSISHDFMIDEINKSEKIKSGEIQKLSSIYIPGNLTILATMNTADQNVFTLDTAFQRRWTMRMIENNINNCDYRTDPILDTGVTWERFNSVLNEFILDKNKDTLSSEDKRLGAFFVRKDELAEPTDENEGNPFAEKVIKYLWDDVFKFNKSILFNSEFNSLDKVLRKFKQANGFNRFDIFNSEIRDKLKPLSPPSVQSQPSLTDNGSDGE